MLIGILQTGHTPDALESKFGTYPEMFARLLAGHDFTFRTWPVVDMEFPSSVRDAEGWLITGSRHGVYDDLPFIKPLEGFVRDAFAARVPMVGICFGHQIIASALGGEVEKFEGGWSVGPTTYSISGVDYTLNAWHQDQVTRPPDSAEVIGSSDSCRFAALLYSDRAFTVQPHPEFQSDFLAGLIRTRGKGVVPDQLLNEAESRLGTPTNEAAMADRVAEFFLNAREAKHG